MSRCYPRPRIISSFCARPKEAWVQGYGDEDCFYVEGRGVSLWCILTLVLVCCEGSDHLLVLNRLDVVCGVCS